MNKYSAVMGVLESEASKLNGLINSKHSLIDVNHLIHTDIDPIQKEYPNLNKFKNIFNAVDSKQISKLMDKQLTDQLEILEKSCIISKGVKFDHMKVAYNHIMSNVSKEDFNALIDATVEDYSLFRSNIFPLFFFIILLSIYTKDYKMLFKVYLVYGIYVYSILWKKYFKNCSPELMNSALSIAHKSSLFAMKYKEGGHTAVVEFMIISEINKLVGMINSNKLTDVSLSRSISYIKTRTNQTLKNFSNSAYYKVMNDDNIDQSVDMQKIHGIISNTINMHSKTYNINDHALNKVFHEMNIPDSIKKDTVKLIKLSVGMNEDSRYIEQLRSLYTKLIVALFDNAGNSNGTGFNICSYKFFTKMSSLLNSRGKSIKVNEIKSNISEIIEYIMEKNELELDMNIRKVFYYRILFSRYLYLFYMRPGNCQD